MQNLIIFWEAMKIIYEVTNVTNHFQFFFSFANILAHTNHCQETQGLGSLITLENIIRSNTHFYLELVTYIISASSIQFYLEHQSHTLISNLNVLQAGVLYNWWIIRVSPNQRVRSLLFFVCCIFLILPAQEINIINSFS